MTMTMTMFENIYIRKKLFSEKVVKKVVKILGEIIYLGTIWSSPNATTLLKLQGQISSAFSVLAGASRTSKIGLIISAQQSR